MGAALPTHVIGEVEKWVVRCYRTVGITCVTITRHKPIVQQVPPYGHITHHGRLHVESVTAPVVKESAPELVYKRRLDCPVEAKSSCVNVGSARSLRIRIEGTREKWGVRTRLMDLRLVPSKVPPEILRHVVIHAHRRKILCDWAVDEPTEILDVGIASHRRDPALSERAINVAQFLCSSYIYHARRYRAASPDQLLCFRCTRCGVCERE